MTSPRAFFLLVLLSLAPAGRAASVSALGERIKGLPETTAAECIKKSALSVAVARLASAPQSDARFGELEAAIERPAPEFLRTPENHPGISVLRVPEVVAGNPFIEHMVAGARSSMAVPDVDWSTAPGAGPLLGSATSQGEYNPRTTASRMDALFWLFANPSSPLKGDPEVLKRLLGRILAYCDALQSGQDLRGGQEVYDDFAIAPASIVIREFATLYPELLLPSDRKFVQDAMRSAGEKVHTHAREHFDKREAGYANIDMAMSLELLNFGMFLEDPAMLETSRKLLDRVGKAVLPDGGFHYIGNQNESVGYHDIIVEFLARTHEIAPDGKALDIIKATEWYGPVSAAPIGEYWTAPSWKHTWNSELRGTAGGFFVAGLTGNPLVRAIVGKPDVEDKKSWSRSRAPVAWYRNNLPTAELPDGVLFPDRNIAGPRGRFGRFNYAITLRDIPTDEPGHATLVGAMTTTPALGLNAILMGVGPRVCVGSNREDPRSWAYLTSGMKSSQVMSRTAAALAASYDLAVFGSSTKGRVFPARGQQLWLALEDRLVGLLRIQAADGDPGDSYEGVLRLGTGGTVAGEPQSLRRQDDGSFAYGDLVVVPHGQNFASIETPVVPFRLPRFPITEIQWRGGGGNPRWWVVEVRPKDALPAQVDIGNPETDAPGFLVTVADRSYVAVANFGAEPARVELPLPPERTTFFVPGAEPTTKLPDLLPSGQVMLVAASRREADHLLGWRSYEDMFHALSAAKP